jgi:hypothetical protein
MGAFSVRQKLLATLIVHFLETFLALIGSHVVKPS